MEKVYNKLVRDNIPDIIRTNGEEPCIRVLDEIEYKSELEKKLKEEYLEVISSSGKERIEELADMIEVIKYLGKLENVTLDEIISIAGEKSLKKGAFEKKIFLEKVI